MPYNTRRKSICLEGLGVIKRSRPVAQPSPPNTAVDGEEPPVKKPKRSHSRLSPTVGDMSPPRSTAIRIKEEKPKRAAALSPPPSPVREGDSKVDIEGISDEIVVGAIQQLEKTGNRPHLVKELAAVLATNITAIERYDYTDTMIVLKNITDIYPDPRTRQHSSRPASQLTSTDHGPP